MDEATSARMRSEELEHSRIMHTLHMLTDRYGPRVTGTPNHEAAAKWAIAEMTSWGMKNGHLEPWDFGRKGWLNESATGHIVAPVRENREVRSAGVDAFDQGDGERVGHRDRAAARSSGAAPRKMAAGVDGEARRRGSGRRRTKWSNGSPRTRIRCGERSYWWAKRQ